MTGYREKIGVLAGAIAVVMSCNNCRYMLMKLKLSPCCHDCVPAPAYAAIFSAA